MAKIFISHQSRDSELATTIATRLKVIHGLDCYLDVIDPEIKRGEDLATHIQTEMTNALSCLPLSRKQRGRLAGTVGDRGCHGEGLSFATYSGGSALPPEYLRKWPYLRSQADLDLYAAASKAADNTFVVQKRATSNEEVARVRSTRSFFTDLRKSLGQ